MGGPMEGTQDDTHDAGRPEDARGRVWHGEAIRIESKWILLR